MTICWKRDLWLFTCVVFIFSAVLGVRVPFPFGVWGRMWNSIVSVPDHCLFYLLYVNLILVRRERKFELLKQGYRYLKFRKALSTFYRRHSVLMTNIMLA